MDVQPNPDASTPSLSAAARFWEPGRLLYNAILAAVVLLWVGLSWPHFRPALTLGSFEALFVLALAANLCYCAAYLVDIFMQAMLPTQSWRRFRQALWLLGTLLALLIENYWIADEIYPYVTQAPPELYQPNFASNLNFPAPLAALGFLAASVGLFVALAAVLIFWFARKPQFVRLAGRIVAIGAIVYLVLLFGFSAASRTTTLARGHEKYFCEIDCHLAYSIADVKAQPGGRYVVTLRTRFDETTTSPSRPKEIPLTPSPREVRLLDDAGRAFTPVSIQGTPLLTPLKPADSYITQLEFDVPKDSTGLLLLLNTTPGWPDHLVIGDENSWLHKKTYFAL